MKSNLFLWQIVSLCFSTVRKKSNCEYNAPILISVRVIFRFRGCPLIQLCPQIRDRKIFYGFFCFVKLSDWKISACMCRRKGKKLRKKTWYMFGTISNLFIVSCPVYKRFPFHLCYSITVFFNVLCFLQI